MKKNKSVSGKVHGHREEAEQRLAAKGTAAEQRSDVDVRLAIHELQVHQIELELQNEELRKAQAELEESRSRYSDLYDFAPVGYFTFDQQGLILEVNLTGTNLLGAERSALSKKPFVLFIAPEHQDAFYLHLRQVMQTGTQQSCEIRLIRKDGTWFHAQLASIAGDDGKQNTSLCRTVVTDITERRQAGESLRRAKDDLELRVQERTAELARANELLLEEIQEHKRMQEALQAAALYARTLLEANLDPLVTISRDGKIMDANLATEQAIGLSREQIIGSDFSDYFTEPKKARMGYEQVFKQGFVRDYPLAIKSLSGMVMEVLYNATVFKNSANEVEGVLASARDISARKRFERELSQSELRLKDAQKIAHLGSWEWDVNSDEQRWSEELYRIFGYDPHKMAMTHEISFNAIHPEDQEYVTRMVWESLETNDDYNIDFRVIRADGAMRFLNSQARLYRDNQGRPQRMVGSVLDITDRKNIERELQESEQQLRRLTAELLIAQEAERKRIAGEVHDELGQSMTVLKLRLRTIEKQLLKDQIKLKGECLDLLGYADGILKSVRRISRDLTPSILEDLGLSAAVRWLVDNFKENLDVNIALQAVPIDSLVPKNLQINIYRILQECLTNSGKHAEAQNITVSIRQQQDAMLFTVEDDGRGFDPEQLFSEKAPAQGLGFTTMRERALLLNGKLDISSFPGRGTRITLQIPMDSEGAL